MEYQLIKSNRKTISIQVKDAQVVVRAPKRATKKHIEEFIKLKMNWIEKHLAVQETNMQAKEEFTLAPGSHINLRGKSLKLTPANVEKCTIDDDKVLLPMKYIDDEESTNDKIKKEIISLYKNLAREHIHRRVDYFSDIMGIEPNRIRITSARTRWGSCSGKNNLNFSWFLMMADDSVIDYVVIHELAHIKRHDHSKKFWAIVEEFCPDYKLQKRSLRTLQEKLNKENW